MRHRRSGGTCRHWSTVRVSPPRGFESPLGARGPYPAFGPKRACGPCQGPPNAFPTTGVAVVLWPLHGGVYDVILDGKKIVSGSPNPERDAVAALRELGLTGAFQTIDSQTGRVRMRIPELGV